MYLEILTQYSGSACLALVHSLWQSFVVICGLKIVLKVIPETVPKVRYGIVICSWLLVVASLPINYFVQINQPNGFQMPVSWAITFVAAWGILTLSQLFQFGRSQWKVAQLIRQPSRQLESHDEGKREELKTLLLNVCAEHGHHRPVTLKVINDIDNRHFIAATAGVKNPTIFVSILALQGIRLENFSSILAHEIGHIMRRDYLEEILLRICEVFLFFNPSIYYVHKRLRHERERICDRMAINSFCDPIDYAKNLEAVGEFLLGQQKLGGAVPYSPGDPGTVKYHFKKRISALLTRRGSR